MKHNNITDDQIADFVIKPNIKDKRWEAALACMERGFMNIDPMLSCENKIKYQVEYCFAFADAMLKRVVMSSSLKDQQWDYTTNTKGRLVMKKIFVVGMLFLLAGCGDGAFKKTLSMGGIVTIKIKDTPVTCFVIGGTAKGISCLPNWFIEHGKGEQ